MSGGLIDRLTAGERSNALDVLIEIAVFRPDASWSAIRANCAGTKVIYTDADGYDATFWARDWSLNPTTAVAALRRIGCGS